MTGAAAGSMLAAVTVALMIVYAIAWTAPRRPSSVCPLPAAAVRDGWSCLIERRLP